MKTYNITDAIYKEMVKRAERYETCFWDCIDTEDGYAVTFALENGEPYEVEVYDEDGCQLAHDFSLTKFEKMAS